VKVVLGQLHVIDESVQVIQELLQVGVRETGMGASGYKSSRSWCKWVQIIQERVQVIDDLLQVV
jgi:hypothetical protein